MSAEERDLWRATVGDHPASYFRRDQTDLLALYCQHVVRARVLNAALAELDLADDLDRYVRLSKLAGEEARLCLALARSLRLTNQSRLHVTTAGSRSAGPAPSLGIEALSQLRHDR